MIWTYWPLPALQNELTDDLLDKLQNTIPIIDHEGDHVFFETDTQKLEQLLAAFAPEDYFRNIENMRKCLYYLPPAVFNQFIEELGVSDFGQCESELEELAGKIARSAKLNDSFLSFFQIPSRFERREKHTVQDKFICMPPSPDHPVLVSKPYKTLKDYQTNVFLKTSAALEPLMARSILQMPTGSGKTRTAMELIAHFFNGKREESSTVVWLANSNELCEQAISCFIEVWEHVGLKPITISRSPIEGQSEEDTFVVSSLQKFWGEISSGTYRGPERFAGTDLVVVDEAHISVAPTYLRVIQELSRGSGCRILGLTATPGRTDMGETTELSDLFHQNIVSLEDPTGRFHNVITFLKAKGVLSDVDYQLLEVTESQTIRGQDVAAVQASDEFSDRLLKKIGQDEIRNAQIIERLVPFLESGKKGLLFAPSIEASKFITSLLLFLGFPVAHVDGGLSPKSRHSAINDYVEGRIQLICNYGVLATGFDAPKTDFLCIARPTKSPVLYSQMIGRGLRGPAVGGTDRCTILEVRDTYINMGLQEQLYRYFEDYWRD